MNAEKQHTGPAFNLKEGRERVSCIQVGTRLYKNKEFPAFHRKRKAKKQTTKKTKKSVPGTEMQNKNVMTVTVAFKNQSSLF